MSITKSKVAYTAELMIVYDEREDFALLNEIFMSEGYLVRFSKSGKRALVSIAAKLPDFITKPFNRQEVIVRVGTHLNFRIHQMQIEKDNTVFQPGFTI
jgi:DNA-binding response OmpR family regulator